MSVVRVSAQQRGARRGDPRARRAAAPTSPERDTSRRRRRGVGSALLAVACALTSWPGLRSQRPVEVLPVAGARAVAVGVLFGQGFDDDPEGRAGLAAVVAAARLEQGRRAVAGELLASGAKVGGDYAIVFAVVASEQRDDAVAFVRALHAAGATLDDDALQLAVARAALAADDAEHLYPGDVLRTRARRRLARGTALARPPAGVARECSQLSPGAVRAALAAPTPSRVAALGDVGAAWGAALQQACEPGPPCPPRGRATCAARWGQRAMTEDVSARADSPYVAAAVAAPAAAARASFAVALEVARARAFERFGLRGRELFARAPFVRWSWLEADPIAVLYRRGEDPVQVLPGERGRATIADELAATRAELEALLEDLRARAPGDAELAAARDALRGRLGLPPAGGAAAWAEEPATYPGRVQVLLLRAHHAVDVAQVDGVTSARASASLAAAFAPDRVSWHAVTPRPRDRLGYRRR